MAWWWGNGNDLSLALVQDRLEDARILIGNGEDVNQRDVNGRRPLDCCIALEPCYLTPSGE